MSKLIRRGSTRLRQDFANWERTIGQKYVQHRPGEPNYVPEYNEKLGPPNRDGERRPIGYQVFPRNTAFLSQPVLSEGLKRAVYGAVTRGGSSIRRASVDFKMDIRRVGAVIRLKEIENQWRAEGKPLATAYSNAVMEMLPQTELETPVREHEPINELAVHPSTRPQLFWPVAESQHFTRVEASKAFAEKLLPAEARIPHHQLYKISKSVATGINPEQARREEWAKVEQEDVEAHTRIRNRIKKKEARTTVIQTPRCQYKFESVTVNKGSVGKFVDGIGQRYGVPHQDRKKGHQDRIPSHVDG